MARPQPVVKTEVHDNNGVDTACWGVGVGCMNVVLQVVVLFVLVVVVID